MDRKKSTTSPYPAEFCERAVRMVEEHVEDYRSLTAAVVDIASEPGLLAGQAAGRVTSRRGGMPAGRRGRAAPRRPGSGNWSERCASYGRPMRS